MAMSVDQKCVDLAEFFVDDEDPPLSERKRKTAIQEVAEAIQTAIEDSLTMLRDEK